MASQFVSGVLRLIIAITSLVSLCAAQQNTKPNIIFILADDLGWDDIAFHGSDQIPTPNIDALAYRGIILNNYYVAPICSPSRSAILTGKHPIHTGMQVDVIYGMQPYGLPLSEKILPQHLKDLGYATHIVGKWHQGFYKSEYTPTYRGFDSHFGYWCGHQDYYSHEAEESGTNLGFDMRRNMSIDFSTDGNYSTWLFTNEAINLINNHDTKQPLFLYLTELAVHAGNSYDTIQAPADYVDKFSDISYVPRRKFAGVMTALDESVGNVTQALANRGMLNNTIIIFSTDNGGAAGGYDGNCASNWPLKGTKDTLWEGGVRGSGLIWSPLLQNVSRVSDQMMAIEDWLPTLYKAAGGDPTDLGSIDGVNMWEVLSTGSPSPTTELLHNIDDVRNISALRSGDYKIVLGRTHDGAFDWWFGPYGMNLTSNAINRHSEARRSSALDVYLDAFQTIDGVTYNRMRAEATVDCGPIPANKTLCRYKEPCLYDIASDPCEYHNIAEDHPDIVAQLLDRLDYYRSTAVAPLNADDDPLANPKLHGYAWVPWQDAVTSDRVTN